MSRGPNGESNCWSSIIGSWLSTQAQQTILLRYVTRSRNEQNERHTQYFRELRRIFAHYECPPKRNPKFSHRKSRCPSLLSFRSKRWGTVVLANVYSASRERISQQEEKRERALMPPRDFSRTTACRAGRKTNRSGMNAKSPARVTQSSRNSVGRTAVQKKKEKGKRCSRLALRPAYIER